MVSLDCAILGSPFFSESPNKGKRIESPFGESSCGLRAFKIDPFLTDLHLAFAACLDDGNTMLYFGFRAFCPLGFGGAFGPGSRAVPCASKAHRGPPPWSDPRSSMDHRPPCFPSASESHAAAMSPNPSPLRRSPNRKQDNIDD